MPVEPECDSSANASSTLGSENHLAGVATDEQRLPVALHHRTNRGPVEALDVSIVVHHESVNADEIRPGTVIERKALYRGPDYEIDYDRGTLLFRRPMRATEFDPFGNTLVRRIVVTYQFEADDDTNIYGGRLQYNFSQDFQQERWVGTT